ncbi:unnamed protein product [Clonostachys rosea]|uniref:Uncharacterized protein n=1 Tax=Bionectria ochroleuca TaxID=29856 RepID=A0ABY6TW53_BIOOC|nr:unnamed protein product [Clonostachys rosea]
MLALQTLDGYPIEDELFQAVRRYKNTGKPSISLVFGFQVYLNIRRCMEKDGLIFSTFQKAITEMQNHLSDLDTYDAYKRQGSDVSAENVEPYMLEVAVARARITSFTEDKIFQEKERISKLTGYNPPETVRHRFLRVSPLMCGLCLFYCRKVLREIALHTDRSETLIACAHIYNALKKENLLEACWLDMDAVLSLMGHEVFWIRREKPGTYYDYWKALSLRLGVSASVLTDICRPGAAKIFRSWAICRPLASKYRLVSCHFPVDTIMPFKPLRNMPVRGYIPVTDGDNFIWTPSEIENAIVGGSLLTALLESLKQILPHENIVNLIDRHEILSYGVVGVFHFSRLPGMEDGKLMGAAADVVDKWLSAGRGDADKMVEM